jgi:hypothetical protein
MDEPSAEARYLETVARMNQAALFAEFKSVHANFLYWKDRCERRTKERDTTYRRGIEEAAKIVRVRACGFMSLPSNAIFNAGLIVEDLSRLEQRIRALATLQDGS